MKPIWSGSISFGLVSIPIKLYPAIEHRATKFRLLHKKDNAPITYKKYCSLENREVSWDEIVRAIEISKEEYYTFSEEELEEMRPERSYVIDLIEFIDPGQIDPIYINNHYYLAPEEPREKSFSLFRYILQITGRVAVGRFIFRDKEHTCIIRSYKNGILLTTLSYQYEIRDISRISELSGSAKLEREEIDLAKQLAGRFYNESFKIEKFKDTFNEKLTEAISKKQKGIPLKKKPARIKAKRKLIDQLRDSLTQYL